VTTARAELLKLATLPGILLTVALTWAVTALITLAATGDPDPIPLARAGFLVLGVLAASSEYEGGQLRTTLLATPRRVRLELTKAGVLAGVTVPVSAVTVLIAGRGDVAYLVLITLIAAGVTTVLRHALAGVVVTIGYYFVLSPFLGDRVDDSGWWPVLGAVGLSLAATVVVARRDVS
jgi:ABC-2 type transport system permease protein